MLALLLAFAQPALDRFVIRVLDPSGMYESWCQLPHIARYEEQMRG